MNQQPFVLLCSLSPAVAGKQTFINDEGPTERDMKKPPGINGVRNPSSRTIKNKERE